MTIAPLWIYATVDSSTGAVEVSYIATNTNHELGVSESKHLQLSNTIKESMSIKLQGLPIKRIMDGMTLSILTTELVTMT